MFCNVFPSLSGCLSLTNLLLTSMFQHPIIIISVPILQYSKCLVHKSDVSDVNVLGEYWGAVDSCC